ncbi:MAG TPA: MBL fold metallo-hydrolase [Caulobacteraceae bacterium]|nr:MBL fold metallo-hydrolase [Caulobacteraceae bacterium]
MQEILPGVYLVEQNGRKGFGYAHFVQRPSGNLVLDASRTTSLTDAFADMAAAGGVAAVVISDRHLGGPPTNQIADHFGARVYCSQIEADAMGHRTNAVRIDHVLPYERATVEGDVRLIPTPGHTAGQFATLCEVGGRRILFSSDFVWRQDGRWRPGAASRRKMRPSFDALRDLDFDTVVPWTGYGHTEFFVDVPDVNAAVDEMIDACPKP